jgi:hypothetical protein
MTMAHFPMKELAYAVAFVALLAGLDWGAPVEIVRVTTMGYSIP